MYDLPPALTTLETMRACPCSTSRGGMTPTLWAPHAAKKNNDSARTMRPFAAPTGEFVINSLGFDGSCLATPIGHRRPSTCSPRGHCGALTSTGPLAARRCRYFFSDSLNRTRGTDPPVAVHFFRFRLLVSPVVPSSAWQVGASVVPSVRSISTVSAAPALKSACDPPPSPMILNSEPVQPS